MIRLPATIAGRLLLMAGLFCATPALCQDRLPAYTLMDLYRMALVRAESIDIARADVTIAEQTRKQALAVLMPTITGAGDVVQYSEAIVSDALIQPDWTGSWGIRAGQRITLNGRELTALHMAEKDIERRKYDLAAVQEAVLFGVASAFFELAKSEKAADIAAANVRRLKLHRQAVILKLKLAEVPKTELFRTEAELSRAHADRIRAENAQHAAAVSLGRIAGLSGPFQVVGTDDTAGPPPDPDMDELKRMALAHRAELKSLDTQAGIADKQIRYQQGAFWPTVGWEGAWLRFEQGPASDYDESAYVGLSVSFDFFDGGLRRARLAEARTRKHQAELARSDAARQIVEAVEHAWLELKTQESVIDAYESQVRYARENYQAVTRLFEHGMADSIDVMDANTLLVTSERERFEAMYNLQLAVLRLERTTGTFLPAVRQGLDARPEKTPPAGPAEPAGHRATP